MSSEDLTIKQLILLVRDFVFECLRSWIIILIIMLCVAAYFFYNASTVTPTYTAKYTFMVNDEEGSGGGLSSILGQFGIGGMSSANLNLDKIVELSQSRKIISKAVMAKKDVKGKNDFLANHIIDIYGLRDKWKERDNGLGNFAFTHGNLDSFSRKENKALKAVQGKINGNPREGIEGLVMTNYSDNTGILKMVAKTQNEELSINLTDELYETLKTFYTEKSVTNFESTYQIIKQKVDSLESNLKAKNYALLKFEDANRKLSQSTYLARKYTLQAEVSKLTTAYQEAYKNQEFAEFALKNNTPDIVAIDEPIAPLKPVGESIPRAVVLGLIVGGILGVAFVIMRKIFRDAMSEEEESKKEYAA